MGKEKLSMAEFYQKYANIPTEDDKTYPALRDVDIAFFDMVDKARKDGKNIVINRRRGFDWDGYMASLTRTAMQLTEGNKIWLVSQKPNKFIEDLKRIFNIEVNTEPSKDNKGINIISLKS